MEEVSWNLGQHKYNMMKLYNEHIPECNKSLEKP